MVLSIEDNGKGFDPEMDSAGMVLLNTRERVKTIGGELSITSEPQVGTKVVVFAPIARIENG